MQHTTKLESSINRIVYWLLMAVTVCVLGTTCAGATTISATTPATGTLITTNTRGMNYLSGVRGVITLSGEDLSSVTGTYCMYWRETTSSNQDQDPECGTLSGAAEQITTVKHPTSYAVGNLEIKYNYTGKGTVTMTAYVQGDVNSVTYGQVSAVLETNSCSVDVNTTIDLPGLYQSQDVDVGGVLTNSSDNGTVTIVPGQLSSEFGKGVLTSTDGNETTVNGYYALNSDQVDGNNEWVVKANSNPYMRISVPSDAKPGEMRGTATVTLSCE